MGFIRKWALSISTLLLPINAALVTLQLLEPVGRECTLVVICALFILWILGFFISVSRLAIAVFRKKLSYDAHADAVLAVVIDSLLLFLLALAVGPVC